MQDDTLNTKVINTDTATKETRGEGTVTNQAQQLSENVAIGGLFVVAGIGLMLFNWLMVLITNHYFVKMSFVGPCLACTGVAMMIPVRKASKKTSLESQVNSEEQPAKEQKQKTFHPLRIVLVILGGVLGMTLSSVFVKFLSGTL
jgi:hypothetical protein